MDFKEGFSASNYTEIRRKAWRRIFAPVEEPLSFSVETDPRERKTTLFVEGALDLYETLSEGELKIKCGVCENEDAWGVKACSNCNGLGYVDSPRRTCVVCDREFYPLSARQEECGRGDCKADYKSLDKIGEKEHKPKEMFSVEYWLSQGVKAMVVYCKCGKKHLVELERWPSQIRLGEIPCAECIESEYEGEEDI